MAVSQRSCQRCPLHRTGPLAVSVPLHVEAPGVPLVVLDRPLGDPKFPAGDVRFRALVSLLPEVSEFAVTYAISCWSNPGKEVPTRSVDACSFHRRVELAALVPPLIVTLGDAATRTYMGVDADVAALDWQGWLHATGATIFSISDILAVPTPVQVEALSAYCLQASRGIIRDFG